MLAELISSLKSLLIVTVINFCVVMAVTIGTLYLIDKFKERKEKKKD